MSCAGPAAGTASPRCASGWGRGSPWSWNGSMDERPPPPPPRGLQAVSQDRPAPPTTPAASAPVAATPGAAAPALATPAVAAPTGALGLPHAGGGPGTGLGARL